MRIRYIELASQRIVARAGKRFEIGVSTDAKRYTWQLGSAEGRRVGPGAAAARADAARPVHADRDASAATSSARAVIVR